MQRIMTPSSSPIPRLLFKHLIIRLVFNPSTINAFSFSRNHLPVGEKMNNQRIIRHMQQVNPFETGDHCRREFVCTAVTAVTAASTFGVGIASPSLSNAASVDETNAKFIVLNKANTDSIEDLELDPLQVVDRIGSLWSSIEYKYSRDGLVDYVAIRSDSGFKLLESEISRLRSISLAACDQSTKMAFVINLYNSLIRVAFVTVGIPKSDLSRYSFFDTVAIDIGGDVFTLNDLENGILRANSVPPYHLSKPFQNGDRRLRCAVSKTDPRIHFALNCGARSCPPVRHYTANGLDGELQLAALEFCDQESNVQIDEVKGKLFLSKIFKWYVGDFAGSKTLLASFISQYLNGEKKETLDRLRRQDRIDINFLDYDWTTNDRMSITFG